LVKKLLTSVKKENGSNILHTIELIHKMMKAQAPVVKHDSPKIFALLYIFRVIYIDLIRENKNYKRRNKYGFIKTVIFGKDNKASSQTSFNNRRL